MIWNPWKHAKKLNAENMDLQVNLAFANFDNERLENAMRNIAEAADRDIAKLKKALNLIIAEADGFKNPTILRMGDIASEAVSHDH